MHRASIDGLALAVGLLGAQDLHPGRSLGMCKTAHETERDAECGGEASRNRRVGSARIERAATTRDEPTREQVARHGGSRGLVGLAGPGPVPDVVLEVPHLLNDVVRR
jgi:hypothetical protein